jgi:hypothetical protein
MNRGGRNPGADPRTRTVVVLGASQNPDRYSHRAVKALSAAGFRVVPVNPGLSEVLGLRVLPRLADVRGAVDTLTLYLGPERCRPLIDDIVRLAPGRVILNPGTEFPELAGRLEAAGIPALEACTLVLLATGRF